jgi:sterol desaturase/sphingolipid hydroxylase (fatty acid hydroxylase superfamily)
MTAATRDRLLTARPFGVFVPLLAGILAVVQWPGRIAVAPGLALAATGLLAWTLMEWTVHRAMHWRTRSPLISRFQQRAHLRHHGAPQDLPHAVLRLSGSVPLAGVCFTAALLGFRDLDRALLFQAGLLAGYLWYEAVHLLSHSHCRLPGLGKLGRYHLRHHYETATRTYGVTSPIWDWLFGTLPAVARSATGTAVNTDV